MKANQILQSSVLAVALAGFGLVTGCAGTPPPPSAAMQSFHADRRGDDAPAISRAEPALAAAADRAYEQAAEAHADDESEESHHYLRLADTYWQTAATRYREGRLRESVRSLQADLDTARQELSRVEGTAHQLRAAIAARRGAEVSTGERPMPTTPREQAEYMLDTAIVDLARADDVDAEQRAPAVYTQAMLAYDGASKAWAAGRYDEATTQAGTASRSARQAYEQALPGWQADAVQQRFTERRAELIASLAPIAPPVEGADGQVRIALRGYFDAQASAIRSDRSASLDALAQVAQAFPEYAIRLEGHTTPEGEPTDNLLLSQARALEVRQALTSRGVDAARLSSVGVGQGPAMADADRVGGPLANRRVDVIFTPRQIEVVRTEASVGAQP